MSRYSSLCLSQFSEKLTVVSVEQWNDLWKDMKTPIIEDLPETSDKLVTFLYRLGSDERDGVTSIYLLSGVAGYNFTEQSKFKLIPNTDIAYLTLVLPSELISAYNFVKRHRSDAVPLVELDSKPPFYPRPVGQSAQFDALLNDLFTKGRVITDPLNKNKLAYYKDMDNPGELYGEESILELPKAPRLEAIPFTFEFAKLTRDKLKQEGRLLLNKLMCSETHLKSVIGNDDPSLARNYWIYLPKGYSKAKKEAYPLLLFLDGSSYLDYIPAHCMLEHMIEEQLIPPCVAVFLDHADGLSRSVEYHCNKVFTEFLAEEFIPLLHAKHQLNISTKPQDISLIGASYSGLAAFYTGLSKPDVFGQVIAQSPAFLVQKTEVLDKMIDDFVKQNKQTQFSFEMGCYENTPVEFEFEDGTVRTVNSLETVLHVCKKMKEQNVPIDFHEFVGGHNYVCFRVTLFDRIKELFQRPSNELDEEYNASPGI